MKPLLLLLLLLPLAAAAEPANYTHRITGLFSPDREQDLRRVLEAWPEVQLVSLDFEHAEGVFRYDPAVAFKGTAPEKITERFNQKLGSLCHNTFGIQPRCETPREQLTRVEIPVIGLDCKACCLATYEAVSKIEGVAQATASYREGRVTALIDPAKTSRPALEAALKKKNVTLATP